MKILLISDMHGELEETISTIQRHQEVDMKICLGDIGFDISHLNEFVIVKGNHDKETNLSKEQVVEVENHRILCVHGDMFEASTMEEIARIHIDGDDMMQRCLEVLYHHIVAYAKEKQCDIVCFGHTHIRVHKVIDGVTIVNPGSLLFGMDGNDKSYAMMELEKERIHVAFYDRKGIVI